MSMKEIEAFFPLSPMQQGMLFHTLYAPEAEAYFEQLSFSLQGDFDDQAFERAWQEVVNRHQALRSSFRWEGLKEPVQVVHWRVKLEFERQDWTGRSKEEQSHLLDELLLKDRQRGFNLSQAPLMRLIVVSTAANTYQLVWSHHHLLMDGWSVPIVLNEVATLYVAFSKGSPLELQPPRPYRDYIVWLRKQDLNRAQEFWRKQLKGFTSPTSLTGSITADNAAGHRQLHARLPAAEANRLRNFTRRHQLTLSTVVNGAWALLLSRYSGDSEVLFGVTTSGRPADLEGAESMVGLFINTLPLRVRIDPNESLSNWLKALKSQQMDVLQFEYSPLVDIQGWSDVPRGRQLFESIMVLENYPEPPSSAGNSLKLDVGQLRVFQKSNFPLTAVVGVSQELTLELIYDESKFTAATMTRLLEHLKQLLLELVINPQARAAELPWLTDAERHQLVVEWNDTESIYPSATPLSLLCAQQLTQSPDAIALQSEELQISFLRLHQQANQLAHLFRSKGVAPGQVIALCLPRSPQLVTSILATIKVGAAYLPLDPSYPPPRLSFMMADSDAVLLVTDSETVAATTHVALLDRVQSAVDLSRDQYSIDSQPASNVVLPESLASGAGQFAYINYTSGSTGKPKGILIPHKAVARLVCNTNFVRLSPVDHVAQVSNASFDALTFEVWGSLLNGARLNLVSTQTLLSPVDFGRQIAEQQLNVMFLTSALFNQMVREAPWALDSVTDLLVGGQAVEPKWAKAFLDRGSEGRLLNGYGPTEGTTFSCSGRIEGLTEDTVTVPIGRALANTELYVLDREQRIVPPGVVGELYIGGDGLALGYVNNVEMTAEKFVPDSYARRRPGKAAGGRLYRSGDRARYREDGLIECLGRVDQQVKIRGYRIEPEEVAVVLRQYEKVSEAVVMIGTDHIGERQLVAYVVEREGARLDLQELKSHVRESLPEYMVPGVMVKIDRMPLNPNGKIDFSVLANTNGDAGGKSAETSLTPLTPTQQAIAEIWSDVLKRDRCRVTDSFFDLGGHSLLATQVLSRLNQVFQVSLPLRVLFEAPTIAALAQCIDDARREGSLVRLPPLEPVSQGQDLPLSFTQQRFWFMDRLVRNSARHNVPSGVSFIGKLNPQALEQSFSEIVRRHGVLRTTIGQAEEGAIQVIHPHRPLSIALIDLQHLDEQERDAIIRRLLAEQSQRPFDLTRGPLLRLALLKSSPAKHELLFNSHHIVTDAWSTGLFVRELVTLYESGLEGRPSPLPELPVQYADFAVWQRRLPAEFLDEQLAYWEKQLAGVSSILETITDCSRLKKKRANYGNHAFFLPPGLQEPLATLSRREGVTLFMTLLATYQTLLYRYSGLKQICIGSPILNRNQSETQNLIGCFINLLALNTDVSGNPGFRELLGRVREVTLGAYDHQDLPFEMVAGKMQMGGEHGVSPLVQVSFSLQNASSEQLTLPHLTVSPLPINAGAVEFDLCLLMHSGAEGLGGAFVYNADLFELAEIERLSNHLRQILEQVVINPDCSLLDLELSGTGEDRRPGVASRTSAQLATQQFTF